jgi:hypothetical protein
MRNVRHRYAPCAVFGNQFRDVSPLIGVGLDAPASVQSDCRQSVSNSTSPASKDLLAASPKA